jgi:hypothetical protein
VNDDELPQLILEYCDDHFSDLTDALKSREASLDKTKTFDPTQPEHTMLLLADLAHLFRSVTKTELEDLCGYFGCKLKTHEVEQHLFVLRKLNLIHSFEYGGTPWYTSDREFMEYSGADGSGINVPRTGVRISKELQAADSKRGKAFRSYLRTNISGGITV